jgi:hypothetical protein|tara:strand:+ start:375 stop:884 length:510 start_codon:yes stop_codon:yes gene_type:complete
MENWKDVNGYEGYYAISDLGNVKSLTRKVMTYQGLKVRKERVIKPYITNGYSRFCLHKDGFKKMINIHRLVAIHFIPIVVGKNFVNHKDGDRSNNVISNLEWCTQKENIIHKFDVNGYKVTSRKLTKKQVLYIRSFKKSYGVQQRLANELNVSHKIVSDVINNKTYKNL